jgi:hypothetical protein
MSVSGSGSLKLDRVCKEHAKSGYAFPVRLVLMLLGAIFVIMLIGFVLSALKWLLIVAVVVAALGLLAGWRPGSRTPAKQ